MPRAQARSPLKVLAQAASRCQLVKRPFGISAPRPAPDSTTPSAPCFNREGMIFGINATRRSYAFVSRTTPMQIVASVLCAAFTGRSPFSCAHGVRSCSRWPPNAWFARTHQVQTGPPIARRQIRNVFRPNTGDATSGDGSDLVMQRASNQSSSRIVALAMPPPSQMVCRP